MFSGIGVATYESTPQGTDYRVEWSTEANEFDPKTGTRTGNGAITIDLPIDMDNITEVTINVRVAGAGPRLTAVTATVRVTPVNATAPDAKTISLAASPTGGAGDTSFTVNVQDLPTVDTASGADENETYENLNAEYRTETGSGTWRITIDISGATSGPGPGTETFNATVTGEAKTYKPALQPLTPDINR